jgi:hypothetical protein
MLIPFGVLSAAGAGVEGATYELISSSILGTAAATVNFTDIGSLATDYKHLQLRYVVRTSGSYSLSSGSGMIFNLTTSSSYSSHRLIGNGSSVTSEGFTSNQRIVNGFIPGATATASSFAAFVTDILDFSSTTKNTTVRSLNGTTSASDNRVSLISGAYISTDAITNIRLTTFDGSNFVVGSRFSLYGVRG